MKKIIISTDSVADLPKEIIDKYDIKVLPFNVILGLETLYDGVDISPQDIYSFVDDNGKLPKTAAPGINVWFEYFKDLSAKGTVIHIGISELLSSALQSAKNAANEFKDIHIVDSKSLSTGIGLVVVATCEAVQSGKKLSEILTYIDSIIPKVQASFVIDSLDYLYKGGRCSALAALGANLLKLHPMLQVVKGKIEVGRKFRGNMSRVYQQYVETLLAQTKEVDTRFAFITHTNADESDVENLKQLVIEKFGFETVYTNIAGSTITCHCGKKTLGLLFINK